MLAIRCLTVGSAHSAAQKWRASVNDRPEFHQSLACMECWQTSAVDISKGSVALRCSCRKYSPIIRCEHFAMRSVTGRQSLPQRLVSKHCLVALTMFPEPTFPRMSPPPGFPVDCLLDPCVTTGAGIRIKRCNCRPTNPAQSNPPVEHKRHEITGGLKHLPQTYM